MNNDLENLTVNICLTHEKNDNKAFFSKIQLCIIDCIKLLSEELVQPYERIIIDQAENYWLEDNECISEVFKTLRIIVGLNRVAEEGISEKRINVLDVINGILLPYENYEPNKREERTEAIDYYIFYLLNAGISEEDLIVKLKKHF